MTQRVVLITGASSGIGASIAKYLQDRGFQVYGTSRYPENNRDSEMTLLRLDVSDEESIHQAVQLILEKEGRIDILINNAGVGITGALEELSMVEVKRHFDTNLFGPIAMIQAVLPQMRKQRSGMIINVTSIAGYMGLPYRSAYSASKGALELITEALSMEVKSFGIKVLNIAPGDFATNIAQRRYHAPIVKGSDYEENYDRVLRLMNTHVDSGNDPEDMAKAVYRIINSSNPALHYKVGSILQKFSIVLKRILPDRVYEKILMNHYKL